MPEPAGCPKEASAARIYPFATPASALALPRAARAKSEAVFARWGESEAAEALLKEVLHDAPNSLGVRIVAYRFYFYRRHPLEAARWALECLDWLGKRLGLPRDWRRVSPDMASFTHWHAYPCLWLQSLAAYGYSMARLGHAEQCRAAQNKLDELDPSGRLGTARLRPVSVRGCCETAHLVPGDEISWIPDSWEEPT
jgi:hypothetical protein